MNELLKKQLSGNLRQYGSIPFWSWNNSLDEGELCRQIEEMKSEGIEGFIMHARTGLKDEYLGEKWFSCVKACLNKAKELDMDAWVYDENGWPSGFVGGKLLENYDFRARFLEYKTGDFDKAAYAVFIEDDVNGYVRVTNPVKGISEYHNVFLRVSPANTDILNPDVTDAFIKETHEKYYERFKDSFGKELVGFFTDEPQYYRWATPYTRMAEKYFSDRGEDIRDGLIWLFKDDPRGYKFRTEYYSELNRLYVENFYKKIYEWCKAHGCKLTGHSIEEGSLGGQMWGGGAVMPTYEYEDIPAMDWLGRFCGNDLAPRQIASVAAQLGKKRVLTETYGCSGYDVTPEELKSIADFQYFNGVNMMCQHLYPYSVAGQGRIDHPPVFGRHGNWSEGFGVFNNYFKKLAFIISNTVEKCNVLVIHPQHDIWLHFIRTLDLESVKAQDEKMNELLAFLRKYGVAYQFADETILKKYGKVANDKIIVGGCEYDTVIVPEMQSISRSTYNILKQYAGKLCVLSDISYVDGAKEKVELVSNITLEELKSKDFRAEDGNVFITRRSGEIGDFIFIKNTAYAESAKAFLSGVAEEYRALDLVDLEEKNISDELMLKAGEGFVLIKDEKAKPCEYKRDIKDLSKDFYYSEIGENYLVSDCVRISFDGDEYGDNRPIPALFESLLRKDYKGRIYVKHEFTVKEKVNVKLITEKAKLLSAAVNGSAVTFTDNDFDVNYCECDISEFIKIGVNEFVYSFDFYQHDGVHFALFDPLATESLRNCLYYDTSIETIYLKGDFSVGADHSLSAKKLPETLTSELYKNGYPFFKGEAVIKGKITKPEIGRAILQLKGRFMTADIRTAKGRKLLVLDTKADITDLLNAGENNVTITLRSSMRNIYGPHHYAPVAEPFGVSPYNFTFMGTWKDGDAPDYTHNYNSVNFGVDSVLLINENIK